MVLRLRDEGKCPCSQETQAKVFVGEVHDRYISYVNKERHHLNRERYSQCDKMARKKKKPAANQGERYATVHYTVLHFQK